MFFLTESFNNFLFSVVLAGLLLFQIVRNPTKPFTIVSIVIAGLMLLSMRIPVIQFNNQLNVDESQMVSNLRLFKIDPIYWKSIDGGTIGPLAYYIALGATYFFDPIDFTSLRCLGFFCLVFNLVLFYKIALKTTEAFAAKLSTFLLLCFFTFLTHPDFLHYSSEQLPVLLINISLYLQLVTWGEASTKKGVLFFIGFLLAMIPFVKIQAIPICGIIGLFQLIHFYRNWRSHGRANFIFFCSGIISYFILFIAIAAHFQVLNDWWTYYIEDNIIYTGTNKTPYGLFKIIKLLGKSFDFFALFLVGCSAFLLAKLLNRKGSTPFYFYLFVLLFLSGLFAAVITRNNFPHYLYLIVFPIGLIFAYSVHSIPESQRRFSYMPLIITLIWIVGKESLGDQFSNHLAHMKRDKNLAMSPVGTYLQHIAKPGDRMSVWGWQGSLYIEANILQASSENQTIHCMQPSELKDEHIQRYLRNLESNKARIIVDASQDDPLFLTSIEKVPEVNRYIQRNYSLDTTIARNRIFIRRLLPKSNH